MVECTISLGETPRIIEQEPIVVEIELKQPEKIQEEIKIPEVKEEQPTAEPKGLFYRLATWIGSLFR